jgi:ABC-type sugar transport system ATPase subunit
MNFIKGQVRAVEGARATIAFAGAQAMVDVTPGRVTAGDEVTVGIRPEHMAEEGRQTFALQGRIDAVERLGESSFVYMRIASGDDVIVRAPGETEAASGETYTAHVPGRSLHVFDAEGMSVLPARG